MDQHKALKTLCLELFESDWSAWGGKGDFADIRVVEVGEEFVQARSGVEVSFRVSNYLLEKVIRSKDGADALKYLIDGDDG